MTPRVERLERITGAYLTAFATPAVPWKGSHWLMGHHQSTYVILRISRFSVNLSRSRRLSHENGTTLQRKSLVFEVQYAGLLDKLAYFSQMMR
jgi:hypothetical protein